MKRTIILKAGHLDTKIIINCKIEQNGYANPEIRINHYSEKIADKIFDLLRGEGFHSSDIKRIRL